jgi:RNA polymerase-binding transcription factor
VPPALTPEQLDRFRAALERERDTVQARIRERAARIRDTVRSPDELADTTDQAAMTATREDLLVENELDADTLEKVARALDRVHDGTYGTSEVSGRPIPLERLEAVPWATTLVDEPAPDSA